MATSDDAAIRAILAPVLVFLAQHMGVEGTLPETPLGYGVPFAIRSLGPGGGAPAVEVTMTITPKRRRRGVIGLGESEGGGWEPLIRICFGEGRRAPKATLALGGEGIEGHPPAYAGHLATFVNTMRQVALHTTRGDPAPSDARRTLTSVPAAQASQINNAYGARGHRGPRVKGILDGLTLAIRSPVSPTQAHVMLAAARLCGLLGPDTMGGAQTAQAVSTLLSTVQLHQAAPAPRPGPRKARRR